jgi:hypothetical protein
VLIQPSAEMTKPTGSDIQKSSSSREQERMHERLVTNFRVSKRMRPFVGRMRLRVKDFDRDDPARESEFTRCQKRMRAILAKKKIPIAEAKRAIDQTLEITADHQLQRLRHDDSRRDRLRSARNVRRLISRLRGLAAVIAKLPPVSKGRLNTIVAEHTAQFFDTETFTDLIRAIAGALAKLSPKRRAKEACPDQLTHVR